MWRFEALLWQAGGDILTPDGKHAAFDSPAGVKALTLLQHDGRQDHSVYLDNGNDNYAPLFNSGKIAMLYTGPWDLSQFPNVDFGVQILPGDLNHQTISGPDNWVLFNNGYDRAQGGVGRSSSGSRAPQQQLEWSTEDRRPADPKRPMSELPGYKQYISEVHGRGDVRRQPENAVKVRPVTPLYPKISAAIGPGDPGGAAGQGAAAAGARRGRAAQVNAILAQPYRAVGRCGSCGRSTSSGWLFVAPGASLLIGLFGLVPIGWSFADLVPAQRPGLAAALGRDGQLPGAAARPRVPRVDPAHDRVHAAVRPDLDRAAALGVAVALNAHGPVHRVLPHGGVHPGGGVDGGDRHHLQLGARPQLRHRQLAAERGRDPVAGVLPRIPTRRCTASW